MNYVSLILGILLFAFGVYSIIELTVYQHNILPVSLPVTAACGIVAVIAGAWFLMSLRNG